MHNKEMTEKIYFKKTLNDVTVVTLFLFFYITLILYEKSNAQTFW